MALPSGSIAVKDNMYQKKILSLFQILNEDWADPNGIKSYPTAMLIEAMETYQHTNWEWWKNLGRPVDEASVRMEVVDIFMCLLAECKNTWDPVKGQAYPEIINPPLRELHPLLHTGTLDVHKLRDSLKRFMHAIISYDSFASRYGKETKITALYNAAKCFWEVVMNAGMSFNDLYVRTVGKIELVKIREANGQNFGTWKGEGEYKEGMYSQIWTWPQIDQGYDLATYNPLHPAPVEYITVEDTKFVEQIVKEWDPELDTAVLQSNISRLLQSRYDQVKEFRLNAIRLRESRRIPPVAKAE